MAILLEKCSFCNIKTDGYFEVGNHDRLLKLSCCENCYDTLIRLLPQEQRRMLIDLATMIVYEKIPCDFKL